MYISTVMYGDSGDKVIVGVNFDVQKDGRDLSIDCTIPMNQGRPYYVATKVAKITALHYLKEAIAALEHDLEH